MYNAKLYANIRNYGNYLVEQSTSLSDNLNDRLRDYLDLDEMLTWLGGVVADMEDGDEAELEVPQDLGVDPEDKLWVRVDKTNPNDPKFVMWIMNDEYVYGDIDFELAANKLYQAGQEGSAVTYVTNFIGSIFGAGDPGDAGTDEQAVVTLMGALVAEAKAKDVDPKLYFDRLTEVFNRNHGSLTDFLETEFSGRAEAVALSAFRQPVESSWTRGMNMGQIVFDLGLTILTFGGGTAAASALRGASGGARVLRYTEAAAGATRAAEAAQSTSRLAKALSKMQQVFRLMPRADKAAKLQKAFPIGKEITYLTKASTEMKATVTAYKDGKIFLKAANGSMVGPNGIKIANLANDSSKIRLAAGTLAKIVPEAKGSAAILAGDKIIGGANAMADGMPEEPGIIAKGAEIMNWYDTVTADPSLYTQSLYGQGPMNLANELVKLKQGSGFFGNTTNQEELMLALIATSLTPAGASEVEIEYGRLAGGEGGVYAMLDDELGGDMGMFAKAYWSAATGNGAYAAPVQATLQNIRPRK